MSCLFDHCTGRNATLLVHCLHGSVETGWPVLWTGGAVWPGERTKINWTKTVHPHTHAYISALCPHTHNVVFS